MTLGCILHNNGQVAFIIKHLFEPEQTQPVSSSSRKYKTHQELFCLYSTANCRNRLGKQLTRYIVVNPVHGCCCLVIELKARKNAS